MMSHIMSEIHENVCNLFNLFCKTRAKYGQISKFFNKKKKIVFNNEI